MSGLVRRLARNTAGRDVLVGDSHGHFSKLAKALYDIGFDTAVDRLISVGDLVDRGPECDDALDWLKMPWFHAVRGNHEDMAIRWPNGNMDPANYAANGGSWNISNTRDAQLEFASAFSAMPLAIEIDTAAGLVGVVHAECPFQDWQQFTAALEDETLSAGKLKMLGEAAMWSRNRISFHDDSPVAGVRAVVVGHTPMLETKVLGNTIYIDTMAWRGGVYTLLDASTLSPARAPHKEVA